MIDCTVTVHTDLKKHTLDINPGHTATDEALGTELRKHSQAIFDTMIANVGISDHGHMKMPVIPDTLGDHAVAVHIRAGKEGGELKVEYGTGATEDRTLTVLLLALAEALDRMGTELVLGTRR